MSVKRFLWFFLLLFLAPGIPACAVASISSLKNGTTSEIKPLPDQSIIIVYRNENSGFGIPVILFMDDKKIGEIPIKTYYRFVVSPGRHIIRSESDTESVFEVLAEKGKVYFVHQKVETDFIYDYLELVQVNEERGSVEMRECQRMNTP